MSSSRQLKLALPKRRIEHGGEDHANARKRKEARPFDPIKPLHVTLRASRAIDGRSMLHPKRVHIIKKIVQSAAKRRHIELKRYVCVGNHLHLLIQTKSRRMAQARPSLRAFLRETTGLIARLMNNAEKGRPSKERFWDHLAWSRVVEWGKDLLGIHSYFDKNERDAIEVLMLNNWPLPNPGG